MMMVMMMLMVAVLVLMMIVICSHRRAAITRRRRTIQPCPQRPRLRPLSSSLELTPLRSHPLQQPGCSPAAPCRAVHLLSGLRSPPGCSPPGHRPGCHWLAQMVHWRLRRLPLDGPPLVASQAAALP